VPNVIYSCFLLHGLVLKHIIWPILIDTFFKIKWNIFIATLLGVDKLVAHLISGLRVKSSSQLKMSYISIWNTLWRMQNFLKISKFWVEIVEMKQFSLQHACSSCITILMFPYLSETHFKMLHDWGSPTKKLSLIGFSTVMYLGTRIFLKLA